MELQNSIRGVFSDKGRGTTVTVNSVWEHEPCVQNQMNNTLVAFCDFGCF